jgi:hypothetical protein
MRRATDRAKAVRDLTYQNLPERSEIISGVGLVAERVSCQELAKLSPENFDECVGVYPVREAALAPQGPLSLQFLNVRASEEAGAVAP